jgi:signal recognition particle subunit SRP54
MTAKERNRPAILNGSRKQRVAKGAGVTLQEVNDLMNRFEQTQQFVKLMKMGGKNRFF